MRGLCRSVDDASRLFDAGVAPGSEQRSLPAEGTGAEAERGYLQARGAELAVFHRRADAAHAPASGCIAISMLIRPPPTDQSEKSFSPRYTNTSCGRTPAACPTLAAIRMEEHTSVLHSPMHISYAVFCVKKTIHTHIKP